MPLLRVYNDSPPSAWQFQKREGQAPVGPWPGIYPNGSAEASPSTKKNRSAPCEDRTARSIQRSVYLDSLQQCDFDAFFAASYRQQPLGGVQHSSPLEQQSFDFGVVAWSSNRLVDYSTQLRWSNSRSSAS